MAQDNLSSIYSSSLARQLLKEKRVNRIYINDLILQFDKYYKRENYNNLLIFDLLLDEYSFEEVRLWFLNKNELKVKFYYKRYNDTIEKQFDGVISYYSKNKLAFFIIEESFKPSLKDLIKIKVEEELLNDGIKDYSKELY